MTDETPSGGSWPHVLRLPVLGVWTRFASNSDDLIDRVLQRYGDWAGLEGNDDLLTDSPCTVRIVVDPDLRASASEGDAPRYHHRLPDPTRLFVATGLGFGVADTRRFESIAYVDRALLSRPDDFGDGMLDPLTLFLLGARDRQPLHATAIERGGVAILLAGPSGSGKSSLAWAALESGFRILAEEPVYIQIEPRLRVWGRTNRVRLPEDAVRHFPGIRQRPTRLPNGKTKIVVSAGPLAKPYAETAGLCILGRGDRSSPTLERVTTAEAVEKLARDLDPGFHLYADTIGERIRRVAERGAWHLSVGDSPADAIPLLEEVEAALASGP